MCTIPNKLKNVSFRCAAWLKVANREDLLEKNINNFRLCEKHFEKKFINTSGRKRLVHNAFPTLFCKSDHSCEHSIDYDDEGERPNRIEILPGKLL